jgi:diacylglycerol kinase family enzyme
LNRGSGSGRATSAGDRVTTIIKDIGLEATVIEGDGERLVPAAQRAAADGASTLVAAGGDGTVRSVAGVALRAGLAFGVLPLGTLNHFAQDVGIPADLEAALQTLATGHTIAVDVGEVNGEPFLNNSSIGLYPRLVWAREQQQRRGRRKWTALAVASFHLWQQYRRVSVNIDDNRDSRNVRTPFVFIGNNVYVVDGGRIDTRERLDEGVLQLCLAPGVDRAGMVKLVLAAVAGRAASVDRFESSRVKEVTIRSRRSRLGVALDGEMMTLRTPLRYRLLPRALRVVVPA